MPLKQFLSTENERRSQRGLFARFLEADCNDDLSALGLVQLRVVAASRHANPHSLATDILVHAARKNYDIVVLVAGDEDYVPLVDAVKGEGRRVFLWFLEDGLSPVLKRSADYYSDIGQVLFGTESRDWL